MAPSAVVTTTTEQLRPTYKFNLGAYKEIDPYNVDKDVETGKVGGDGAKYPHYLPTWDAADHGKYPPLEIFEHYEHGKDADPSYPNLLPSGGAVSVTHLTPTIGSEVAGIQLSSLTDAGKDELAHFVAKRKVVAFRKQDFAELPIADALKYGAYFGRHHIHPTSGAPEGFPEIHLVHRGKNDKGAAEFFEERTSSVAWHSDVSYEEQPPGTTFLYILNKPETGGDTLFVDSGIEQVNAAAAQKSIKRREPVVHAHPIVRTHPATGEKALFVNPQFTRDIVGLKKEESDALLKFLYDHLAYGADFQARIRWEEGTVVLWDNRVTQHTALVDWEDGQRRHLARITPQAEVPYETPFDG
ncbi:hypothetical protein E4U11_008619 [Claviceps purpurea]|nr:hypothetical protein E4U11_008619 [Claviceps purpurea]